MTSKILIKIDMKNCTCYYFDNFINFNDFDLHIILLDKNHAKIFPLITLYTKAHTE